MMSSRDLYRLEVAALLHDIGKIGVPDSILNKPGPLTPDEWKIMRQHDQIGVEIVRSAFGSERVAGVIESHHYCFRVRSGEDDEAVINESIPLAGRIISVCDAFDSMTHDRVYREAISEFEALEEIVRNTPKQFDIEVVKHLVTHIQDGHISRQQTIETTPVATPACVNVEKHIEDLYAAVASQDGDRLKDVVESLQKDAGSVNDLAYATQRLGDAVSAEEEMEKVLVLAREVMDVCRDSRSAGFACELSVDETQEIVALNDVEPIGDQ